VFHVATMRTVFRRLNGKGDVWAAAFRKGVNLRRMERKLEAILDGLKRRAR